jgi:hypothetical protein
VDKFSLEKIGTGEGAQAYGWGLYFAKEKAVAEMYLRAGTDRTKKEFDSPNGKIDITELPPILIKAFEANWEAPNPFRNAQNFLNGWNGEYYAGTLGAEALAEAKEKLNELIKQGASVPQSNLYTVTLDVNDEDLLDWDKPLSEQSEKVQKAVMPFLVEFEEDLALATTGEGLVTYQNIQQHPSDTSADLLAAGIKGIRFLDGNSRNSQGWHLTPPTQTVREKWMLKSSNPLSQGIFFETEQEAQAALAAKIDSQTYNYVMFDDSLITITAENGQPVTSDQNTSFSLSRDTQNNLQTILEARMSRGPVERTKILETMRERLQSLVFKLENRATGDLTPMEKQLQGWRGKDLTEAQTERLRIEDAISAVKGIVGALPAELRARVSVPLTRILDADTDVKTQNAFKELIQRADNVIEEHLQELYTERIGDLLDLARPTATEARTNKTLLTPDTQTAIDQIADIVTLSPTDLITREATIEAQLLTLQEQIESTDNEDTARELTRQQVALQLQLGDIITFGNLSQQSAAELSQAYEALRTIYVRGRVIRKSLIDAEREKIQANRADLMHAMDKPEGVTGPEYARATDAGFLKNTIGTLKSFAIEHMNVHQALEIIFPNTITVQQWGDRLIKAMRGTNRRKLAANARYESFMRERLGATSNRQRGKILTALATRRTLTDVRIAEIDAMKTEVIPIDYVQKILNGQMTVSYSGDKYAMTQIRQAWRDFLLLPKKKRARTESLKIQVVKSRKKPQSLYMSDLEMLDVLMTAAQESYAPTMDKYGFTEEALEKIREAIDPRALAIGEFLRSEYDANWSEMNPVFQRIFQMNMPNTRNYAPGTFHTSKQGDVMQNELGQAGTASAMSAGATKNRRAHMARPKTMNALAKYFAHVEQTSYWIEYAELVKEIAQTVRHSELFRALDVRHGAAVKTNVNQWIDRLNVDGAHAAQEKLTTDDLINRIMSGQSHLGLAWNLSVPFKQFSAALGSLTMEDPKEALISFSKILHSWPEMKKIFQSEAIQQRIKQGFSPETRSLLDAGKINPSQLLELLHMGHMPAGYADAAFSTISGFVSYDITLRRELARDGRTREQAEKIALDRMDIVLAKTTQPVDTQMKSLVELRNAQGFGRLLFMFKSDLRRAMGIILATAWQYKRGDASKTDLAKVFLTQWVIYGLLGSVGTALFKSFAGE